MKANFGKIAIVGALALALSGGAAFAQQGSGPGPMHHRMMHGGAFMGGAGPFGMMLHRLNLTDDQKAQVKQIMQAEKPNMKPLMQQEFQLHMQMAQLITSGSFDQAKVTALATQAAQTHIQVEVEHAKIASQIYQILDSTQKATVADMLAKHQQRMQQHLQNQEQEPSSPPAQ